MPKRSHSKSKASAAANSPQTVIQEEPVTFNWLFLNQSRHVEWEPRIISIPRPLFNGPAQECSRLFAAELANKYEFVANLTTIKFWKPKDLLVAQEAFRLKESKYFDDESFLRVPIVKSFSKVLEGIENEDIVHLAVTATAKEQDDYPNKKRRLGNDVINRWKSLAFTPPTGSSGRNPGLHDLLTLDLRLRRDRITNIRHLINLSTILPQLSDLVQFPVNDFEKFEQTNSTVEITSTLIVKTYTCANVVTQVQRLEQIYDVLAKWHVPHVDVLVFANKKVVHLSPRGSPLRPQDEKELRECLVCVLESLIVAHQIPLYHRDIRWNNVIRKIHDHTKWFIIDWEDAASPPTKAAPSFATSSHSPAIFHDDHGAEVDIWGVGYLINTCNAPDISVGLKALGERICRESQSLSAEDVHKLITSLP